MKEGHFVTLLYIGRDNELENRNNKNVDECRKI